MNQGKTSTAEMTAAIAMSCIALLRRYRFCIHADMMNRMTATNIKPYEFQ